MRRRGLPASRCERPVERRTRKSLIDQLVALCASTTAMGKQEQGSNWTLIDSYPFLANAQK